jgi:hypothetical protein
MKTGTLILSLLITICSGCSKQGIIKKKDGNAGTAAAGTVYLIKKGNHYAEGNELKILHSQQINCEVLFDSSAMYESVNPENQEDINKLIGFSDCNDHHQQNSARIGWSWNGKSVMLYAYAYINKERVIKPLSAISINEPVKCSIKAIGENYYFTTGNYTDSLPRHCKGYTGVAYKLYPYFGGDETAPHDVRIIIKES